MTRKPAESLSARADDEQASQLVQDDAQRSPLSSPRVADNRAPTPSHELSEAVHRALAAVTPLELEAELYRRSFAAFVERFWQLVTGRPFVANVATEAVIAALQAVGDGRITRLLIALPPGTGKSTMLALYAAWRLARNPSHRSIHAGHSASLADTESRRVRRLIEGDEYRKLYPELVLRPDESTVSHWATTRDGRYFAVGTEAGLLGRRADEAVLDDPLNVTDRFSRAAREALWSWFQESLSTRLDGDLAPIVVVHQRIDRDDLIGKLLEAEPATWALLELAAEYDSTRHCTLRDADGDVVWTDPRTTDGDLLAPTVLPQSKLNALKASSSSTFATMYQQRPSDDANATIKRTWWRFHRPAHVAEHAPRPAGCDTTAPAAPTPDVFDRIVIAADLTFGSLRGDYAVVQAWGTARGARYLLSMWRRKATQLEQRAAIKAIARQFPTAKILIEAAAGGPGTIEQLNADGIPNIVPVTTGGRGKAERIALVSPTIEGGNAYLPLGAPWIGDFVEELAGATKHDDMQDATAYALADLNAHGADHGVRYRAITDAEIGVIAGIENAAARATGRREPWIKVPDVAGTSDLVELERREAAGARLSLTDSHRLHVHRYETRMRALDTATGLSPDDRRELATWRAAKAQA